MKLDYKKAGVDIDKANLFVDAIKKDIKKSLPPGRSWFCRRLWRFF